jgi:hypothetical protein
LSDGCGKLFEQSRPRVEVRNTGSKGININLGFLISFVQGNDMLFLILVVGVGHGDGTGGKRDHK